MRYGISGLCCSDAWQRLDHEPGRIVGIFDGESIIALLDGEQLVNVYRLRSGLYLTECHRIHNFLLVGKDGEIVLFTIAEVVTFYHHAADKYSRRFIADDRLGIERECGSDGFFRFDGDILRLREYNFLILGVDKLHGQLAVLCFFGGVRNSTTKLRMISGPHEAWHVGHHHQCLLRNGFIFMKAIVHRFVMRKAHKLPSRYTFRERKAKTYMALVVRFQSRIEESRFVEILSDG